MSSINPVNNQIVENKQKNSFLSYLPVDSINSTLGASALVLMNLPSVVAQNYQSCDSGSSMNISTLVYPIIITSLIGGAVAYKYLRKEGSFDLEKNKAEIKFQIKEIYRNYNIDNYREIAKNLKSVCVKINNVINYLDACIKRDNSEIDKLNEKLDQINSVKDNIENNNIANAKKGLDNLKYLDVKALVIANKKDDASKALNEKEEEIKENIQKLESKIYNYSLLKDDYKNDQKEITDIKDLLNKKFTNFSKGKFNRFFEKKYPKKFVEKYEKIYRETHTDQEIQTDQVSVENGEKDELTKKIKRLERTNKKLSDENKALSKYADENDKELVDANVMNRVAKRKLLENKKIPVSERGRPPPVGYNSGNNNKITTALNKLTKDERAKIKSLLKEEYSEEERKEISKEWCEMTLEALVVHLRQIVANN